MKTSALKFFGFLTLLLVPTAAYTQQTNNSSSLTNSAAPSASSVTTGGTNINYQTNNAYNNEFGFAPGVFCRTPTLFVGGNLGNNSLDAYDTISESGNRASNYSANVGLVVPFGSSTIDHCKRLSATIVRDREISTQLSMIRACASLEKEGIVVDPDKYPLLEKCAKAQGDPSLLMNRSAFSPAIKPIPASPPPRTQPSPKKVPTLTKS